MRPVGFCVVTGILASVGCGANAGIVRVDPFDSPRFEGFQRISVEPYASGETRVFDNSASVYTLDSLGWMQTTEAWLHAQNVEAYEGSKLFGSIGGVGYRFDEGQTAFGGYFASVTDVSGGQIRFYSGDRLIGTDTIAAPTDSTWAWNGWSSDEAFDRVEIESNHASRGYLMHDALRVLSVTVPSPGSGALVLGTLVAAVRRQR